MPSESAVTRLAFALADRYRIERELGAGGMATVYLAADLKHDRNVAIKVLKPELAAVLGAERFVQEIKTTAALSHPHILPLFDSGEADGFLYYVMPYIEGETIRDRLNRETQLGIDEAVKITTEVADALDYAHRHGVIHRDIKPENILLHDGRPMVMDFGIALAVSAAAGGRMTETGLSLGTPHYMSPEQATADKDITARSDVYSLGAVLYEMLSGEPPHMGTSAQQIIMKIVTEDAQPVTRLRTHVPANVAAATGMALERLPADRFASARAFAEALVNPAFATHATISAGTGADAKRSNLMLFAMAAIAVIATAAAIAGWLRSTPDAPASRFEVAVPAGVSLHSRIGFGTAVAVSRDGSVLAFIGVDSSGVSRAWLKRSGELEAVPVQGSDGAYSPFLSPDASQLGFFREAPRTMNVVSLAGGSPRVVFDGILGVSGASWASDGFIYFDADPNGIERIRPDGSDRQPVLALNAEQRVTGYAWPEVLPGDRVIVARMRRQNQAPEDFEIIASRIGSNEYVSLGKGVVARYHDHHLFIVGPDGTLKVARFDADRLSLAPESSILATEIRIAGDYAGADIVLDHLGALYYVAGPAALGSTLEWIELTGTRTSATSNWRAPGRIVGLNLSPDGRQAMLYVPTAGGSDVWLKQLPDGPMIPLRQDAAIGTGSATGWGADGATVLMANAQRDEATPSQAATRTVVTRQRADGLGDRTVVARDSLPLVLLGESRDGRWIVAVRVDSGGPDIVAIETGRDSVFRPVIATSAVETQPALSPDSRWIAYTSDRSGSPEVYVQPFPDVEHGIWPVSIDGGAEPVWSPTGDRIYFRRGAEGIFAVDVSTTPVFSAGAPHRVLSPGQMTGAFHSRGWMLSPDGKRVLVVSAQEGEGRIRLVRVENVMSEIRRSTNR